MCRGVPREAGEIRGDGGGDASPVILRVSRSKLQQMEKDMEPGDV